MKRLVLKFLLCGSLVTMVAGCLLAPAVSTGSPTGRPAPPRLPVPRVCTPLSSSSSRFSSGTSPAHTAPLRSSTVAVRSAPAGSSQRNQGLALVKSAVDGHKSAAAYVHGSFGSGKSFPFNVTESTFDSPSGGDAVVCDRYFSELCFPCKGYMIGLGGGTSNSSSATAVLFGAWPFAGLRMWGTSSALLPGVGVGAGLAGFWVE